MTMPWTRERAISRFICAGLQIVQVIQTCLGVLDDSMRHLDIVESNATRCSGIQ